MNSITEILIRHGYIILFMGILGEKLGLPLPAGLLLIFTGALAGAGQLNFSIAFLLAVIACLLSDHFWYQIGRRKGGSILPFLCSISLNPDSCVRLAKNIFSRHGAKSLLVVKFFPGVNTIAAPLSGISQMTRLRFFLFDLLGSCIWVGVFISLGYFLTNQIGQVVDYVSQVGIFLWGIVAGSLLVYIFWKYAQRQRFLHRLRMARITPEELKQKLDAAEDLLILDVRNALEFETDPQMIPGAVYLPWEKLRDDPPNLSGGREVILYCD